MGKLRRLALVLLLGLPVAQPLAAADLASRAEEMRLRGDWKGLAALADGALRSGEDAVACRERGRARLELQQWQPALEDLERAVALAPGDAEARFLLGWWYVMDAKDLRATREFDLAPAPRGLAGRFTAVSVVGSQTVEMSGRVTFER